MDGRRGSDHANDPSHPISWLMSVAPLRLFSALPRIISPLFCRELSRFSPTHFTLLVFISELFCQRLLDPIIPARPGFLDTSSPSARGSHSRLAPPV